MRERRRYPTKTHNGVAKKAFAGDLNTVILALLSSKRVVGGDTGGDQTQRAGPAP